MAYSSILLSMSDWTSATSANRVLSSLARQRCVELGKLGLKILVFYMSTERKILNTIFSPTIPAGTKSWCGTFQLISATTDLAWLSWTSYRALGRLKVGKRHRRSSSTSWLVLGIGRSVRRTSVLLQRLLLLLLLIIVLRLDNICFCHDCPAVNFLH